MARKPRIYFPGAIYHVMLRGNGGMQIFFLEEDRHYFYFLINEGIKRYGYEIYAFCLMTNHVHLLLRVGNIPLSKVMQNISFRYAQWINNSKRRIGHLFQGRYKAILVDEDNYLLELVRYIHLNPIRAAMTEDINTYRWSSHRVYMLLDKLPWLSIDWVLSRFSNNRSLAISRYYQFIMKKENEIIDSNFFKKGNQQGYDILGKENFMEKIQNRTDIERNSPIDLEYLVNYVCNYYKVSISELKNASRGRLNAKIRALIAIIAQDLNHKYTLTSTAVYFNRDVSGIIRTIHATRKNISTCKELEELKNAIEKSISQA